MNHKWTYFVSSTFEDLREERVEVANQILSLNEIPIGMEQFGAADSTSWENIEKYIDTADYYILIIAGRYGSLDRTFPDLSFTHREYRYARDHGVPVFPILHSSIDTLPSKFVEQTKEKREKLDAFRAEVQSNHQVAFFHDKASLIGRVSQAVNTSKERYPRPGWTRHGAVAREAQEQIDRLRREAEEQQKELVRLRAILSKTHTYQEQETSGINSFHVELKLKEEVHFAALYKESGASVSADFETTWKRVFINVAIGIEQSGFPVYSLSEVLDDRIKSLVYAPHNSEDDPIMLHPQFIENAQYVFESLGLIKQSETFGGWVLTRLGRKIYIDWRAEQIIPSKKKNIWER